MPNYSLNKLQSGSQTMSIEYYKLKLVKNNKEIELGVSALDAAHAQGQALDISRSLSAEKFELGYGKAKQTRLSKLYERLAFNDFDHRDCFEWTGSVTNKVPSTYVFGKRYYVRPLILGYLDIERDGVVKNQCKNHMCINPYHNQYLKSRNSKLGSGDLQMLLAFRGQGVSASQIAKALNVHRSTIYRNLKHERISDGSQDYRRSKH
ncbi:MAG: hypothetical protein CBD94_01475 [Gammaproteobacteria bacterium TMED234]|nr:MAG: hypothetical protein CBD94_01475 [Gammaproteobacteria bacterium TMED234]|tara:strand:- start:13817 stop:14437 length:621 start_codon:yes stop_codon:yes gene_type:complete